MDDAIVKKLFEEKDSEQGDTGFQENTKNNYFSIENSIFYQNHNKTNK